MTAVYLFLGLALMAGLFYALTQITARQRRLNAELTRLERLAAEVAMNAEAILERVDERLDRLNARVAAAKSIEPPTGRLVPESPAAAPAPAVEQVQETAAPSPPTSIQRYQEARNSVWTLADRGLDPSGIARVVGIPRGEVQLLLNLRGRRVTA